jgi:RimJ/RimL family protein N-acetyltransferase
MPTQYTRINAKQDLHISQNFRTFVAKYTNILMTIRPTTYADMDALLAIFAYARQQMNADGNPTQWGDGYPEREQIEDDIQRGVSYIVEYEGDICGTFVFILGKDPTYHLIENGTWLNDALPYGTIHRIASNGTHKGIFRTTLEWCTARCTNIRIDTHQDNRRMIHLIEQAGFTRCGIIYTRNHTPRIAFQRIIPTFPNTTPLPLT